MKLKIIPDQMGGFEIYGRQYEVCPATDVVMRFVESEYDYLHYLDPNEQAITMHWLGNIALATLVDFGIPESKVRNEMPQCIYEEYISWKSMFMGEFEQELE